MSDTARFKAMLEAQLSELTARLESLAEALAEPLNPDSSEQAVETEDDVSLEGQAALVLREIASTDRALRRIENGTFGQCVRCGEGISLGRLEVRPESARCISCASREQDAV